MTRINQSGSEEFDNTKTDNYESSDAVEVVSALAKHKDIEYDISDINVQHSVNNSTSPELV